MKNKLTTAIGFGIGIWLAYLFQVIGPRYFWVLFYR